MLEVVTSGVGVGGNINPHNFDGIRILTDHDTHGALTRAIVGAEPLIVHRTKSVLKALALTCE